MRFRKIALALLACMALAAVAANAAQAGWTLEGAKELTTSETVTVEGASSTLTGSFSGTTIELSSTSFGCSGTCTIDNTKEAGHSQGKLIFNGVKVVKPANCTVHSPGAANGTVITKELTDKVIMDPTAGSTTVADQFFTDSGAFVELEFTGELCTLNELLVPVNGTVAAESPNKTGVLAVSQGLSFGSAQQTTFGANLFLGTNPEKHAFLTGSATNKLSGENKGKTFGDD
jgi:hypothetical protein